MFGTSKNDPYYVAGYEAFQAGLKLVDKPTSALTNAWQTGWLDALADLVRQSKSVK